MSEEQVQVEEVEREAESQQQGAPSAETKNTEATPSSEEHMIPKSRFDEINEKYKALSKQIESVEKEKAAAEKEALAEQGKYRELWEEAQANLEKIQGELRQERHDALRRTIAQEAGYPDLWARIQGDDEDALRADMKALTDALPKPQAPNLNGSAGGGGKDKGAGFLGGIDPKEFAAIYGLSEKYVKGASN